MLRKTAEKNRNRAAKFGKRGVSVLLAATVVIGTFAVIPFMVNADDAATKNYPLLREVGTDGPTGENWSYNVHEYAEKPDFKASDKNFAAPEAVILKNGDVKLKWTAFSGADSYTVNVYNGQNNLSFSNNNVTAAELTIKAAEFAPGSYQVQLIAFAGSEELSASMVRPFEYKTAVTEESLLTNLNGNVQSGGGRAWANTTDDAAALDRAPAEKLHVQTLGSGSFWFSTVDALPEGTQAVAYWYSQKFPDDGSYYSLRFQFNWLTSDNKSFGISQSSARTVYFIPANSTDKIYTSSTDSQGFTFFDSANKLGEFKEGWIVIPLSNYTDASKAKLFEAEKLYYRLSFATAKYKVAGDGTAVPHNAGDGRRHYVSQLRAVSNLSDFLSLYKSAEDNSYAATAGTDYECDTYTEDKEYYNQNVTANKFSIASNAVSFTATDNISGTKGMQLTFTAPEAGYYDLSQKLAVEGNASAAGDIYYRVKRLSDNKTVYPADSEWSLLSFSGTNPEAALSAETLYLPVGGKLRIEAYAELTSGSEVKINIGNPTLTSVDRTVTAAGEFFTYEAFDYFLSQRNIQTPYYINDRWEFTMLDYRASRENPTEIKFTKYNKSWSNFLYYNTDTPIIGLLGMSQYPVGKRLKFKAAANHGPQLTYNVTEDGCLAMEIPILMEDSAEVEIRIVKNGEQIWPSSGFYAVKKGTIKANAAVKAGDKVSIQIYSDSETEVAGYADAAFFQTAAPLGNNSYDTVYSPLWERPYNYKDGYSGEYTAAPASIFGFGYTEGSNVTLMNAFDASKDNYLYRTDSPEAGFKFGKDDLTYTITAANRGMGITFTVPEPGKYNISAALKVVSGKGNGKFKIKVGDTVVWPENGTDGCSFTAAPGYELDFPALQLELEMGEVVKILATASPEGSEPVVINLGTPAVYRFANSAHSGSETTDIYTPYNFTSFEKERVSKRIYAKSRFEYILKAADGKEIPADTYNTSEKTVTYNSTGFKFSDTGAVTVDIKNTAYTHILRFTAPKDVTGKLQFEVSADKAAQVRVTRNGEQVWPESGWYTASSVSEQASLDAAYKKGDIIEWQVKAGEKTSVELGVPNITDIYHITDYNKSTLSYRALYGNPFGDGQYSGGYKRYDNEAWLYDIADVTDIADTEYLVPDSYNYSDGKYLYNSRTDTGYYFGGVLNATVKNTADGKYGVSLGLVAPRTDAFVFRTGLRIATENAAAKLYTRLTVNGETVWCGEDESGWFSCRAVSDTDIDIPLKELKLNAGDTVRFEVYAEEIIVNSEKADKITLSLASPEFFSEAAKEISDANITAKVLYPYNEFQYNGIMYTGQYIPMENRWNYEFASYGDTAEVFEPDYYNGKNVDLYSKSEENSPHYNLKAKTVTLIPASENAKGIVLRYTSAVKGETIFQAVPKITAGGDTANVKFRIIHNGKKIYPADSAWELLTKDTPKSSISDRLSLQLAVGDDVEIQAYAEPAAEGAGKVTVSLDAFAAVVSYKQESKLLYNFSGENTNPQIDPFWSYEYASDPNNIKWERLSSVSNGYYNIPGAGYCGISNGSAIFGLTNGGSFLKLCENAGGKLPIISATFTAPKEGYYKMGSNAAKVYSSGDVPAKIRITVNDEKVWPADSEWTAVKGNITDFAGKIFHLSAGDKIRFECAADADFEAFKDLYRFRITWPVTLSYSEWYFVYTETKDIYNMLNPKMLAFYQGLAGKGNSQFDEDYEKHYAESLLPDEENGGGNSALLPDGSFGESKYNADSENGEWVDGTETQVIVTPGKRLKIIKRYYNNQLSTWAIILIVAGAVLAAGGVTVLIIVIVKRRKKKSVEERDSNAVKQ